MTRAGTSFSSALSFTCDIKNDVYPYWAKLIMMPSLWFIKILMQKKAAERSLMRLVPAAFSVFAQKNTPLGVRRRFRIHKAT